MMHQADRPAAQELLGNLGGVMHNLNSALMAVHGFIELLARQVEDGSVCELCEQAKRASNDLGAIIDNVSIALKAHRSQVPGTLSMNGLVRGAIELLRSNPVLRSKIVFQYDPVEDDSIHTTPSDAISGLETFLFEAALETLERGDYRLSVVAVVNPGTVSLRIEDHEISFPRA